MFKFHFKRGLIFGILGLAIGGILAATSEKIYEASAEILLGEAPVATATQTLTPDVQRILEVGQANDARTELQVIRSQSMFFQALRDVAQERNDQNLLERWVQLYLMYDVITPEMRAVQQQEGSVATIRVRAGDPRLAEQIANQVTVAYNEFRKKNAQSGLQNAIRYLASQEQTSRESLLEAENKYKAYSTEKGIVNMEFASQSATSLESSAILRVQEARGLAAAAEAEAATLRREVDGLVREIPTGSIDTKPALVSQLDAQITVGRQQLEQLRARYFEDHPRVQEAARSLRALMAERSRVNETGLESTQTQRSPNPVRTQLEAQLATAQSRADGFRQQVSEAESALSETRDRLKALPTDEAQLRQLRRDLDVADLNYRRVKQMLDELTNRQESIVRVAPVLSDARAFRDPVAPDTAKSLFIGLIAGLLVGLIYSFAVEAMKLRVHTSQQLSELTGLPVVATIPLLTRGQQKGLRQFTITGARPNESFRHMAFTYLAKHHEFPRMLMFTGVGSVAGRTSSTLQFALALANTGKRVLVVDCDPYQSRVTKAFEVEGRSGVSEIFERTTLPSEGSDLFAATSISNLTVLPVGSDPSKSLADRPTEQLEAVVAFMKGRADIIVFDVPPCDMFSDASRLASLVDEVCMVVSANTTNYAQIPNGYDILSRAGAKDVSLILTDASPNDEPFANTKSYSKV